MATPEVVLGAGLAAQFLAVGVPKGIVTIILAHTMFCISFVVVTVKARVASLDPALEEAGRDLYGSPAQVFWRITFPLLLPGIIAAALLSFALSFDDFIITNFNSGAAVDVPEVHLHRRRRAASRPRPTSSRRRCSSSRSCSWSSPRSSRAARAKRLAQAQLTTRSANDGCRAGVIPQHPSSDGAARPGSDRGAHLADARSPPMTQRSSSACTASTAASSTAPASDEQLERDDRDARDAAVEHLDATVVVPFGAVMTMTPSAPSLAKTPSSLDRRPCRAGPVRRPPTGSRGRPR